MGIYPSQHQWNLPLPHPMIGSSDVHIWRASLDEESTNLSRMVHTLSRDELQRADRFHFDRDRNRFIAGRGILRLILARYLDIEPSQVKISYGRRGKPALTHSTGGGDIRFNLAHSNDLALYAITRGRDVGIDVEYVRPISEFEQIIEYTLSPKEKALFKTFPIHERISAFFIYWTSKEACLKECGDGLAHPMDEIDISPTSAKLENIGCFYTGLIREVPRWYLRMIMPSPHYIASVATGGQDCTPTYWQWSSDL